MTVEVIMIPIEVLKDEPMFKEEKIVEKDCLPRFYLLTLRDYHYGAVKNYIRAIDHNARFVEKGKNVKNIEFDTINLKEDQFLFVATKYLTEKGLESIKGVHFAIELPDPGIYKR